MGWGHDGDGGGAGEATEPADVLDRCDEESGDVFLLHAGAKASEVAHFGLCRGLFKVFDCAQGEAISDGSEAGDLSDGDGGDYGFSAELLAGVDVAEVDFDDGGSHAGEGITEGN